MKSQVLLTTVGLIGLLPANWAAGTEMAPAGVYYAEEIAASPKMTAAGLVWWKDRLIVVDRGGKRLVSFTPPERFETFKEMKNPVGVAVDSNGDLIVTEKDVPDQANHLLRIKPDGKMEEIVSENVGGPHFVAVHKSGTIAWSGFPDGGTRSLKPGGKVEVHAPRIGHTYGIGFSPKHDALYVSSKLPNAEGRAAWRFPVETDGTIGKGEVFFRTIDLKPKLERLPEAKDGSKNLVGWIGRLQGLAVDSLGHIYIGGAESHTAGEAIAVINPEGKKVVAMILGVPRNVSCLAFGGADGKTLYITGAGEYRLFQMKFVD